MGKPYCVHITLHARTQAIPVVGCNENIVSEAPTRHGTKQGSHLALWSLLFHYLE